MHLSPWLLYLILQLDSFGSALQMLTFLGFICFVLISMIGAFGSDLFSRQTDEEKELWANCKMRAYRFLWLGIITMVLNAAIPSTKTMAAIVVLPAIVNNQNVQKEAGELYQLAKQGLAKAVDNIGKEEPKPKEKPADE